MSASHTCAHTTHHYALTTPHTQTPHTQHHNTSPRTHTCLHGCFFWGLLIKSYFVAVHTWHTCRMLSVLQVDGRAVFASFIKPIQSAIMVIWAPNADFSSSKWLCCRYNGKNSSPPFQKATSHQLVGDSPPSFLSNHAEMHTLVYPFFEVSYANFQRCWGPYICCSTLAFALKLTYAPICDKPRTMGCVGKASLKVRCFLCTAFSDTPAAFRFRVALLDNPNVNFSSNAVRSCSWVGLSHRVGDGSSAKYTQTAFRCWCLNARVSLSLWRIKAGGVSSLCGDNC